MKITLLPDKPIFPNPELADADGLLGISRDINPERLLAAYQQGIFPWFEHETFFFWFCPNPRMVLYPHQLKVHKSMRPLFNQKVFEVTLDTCFEKVIKTCAQIPRGSKNQSWISPAFVENYLELHRRGVAHSVEVWQHGKLVGGLYGICMGAVFFGESMFSQVPNASKYGFITLVNWLAICGVELIDCQQHTLHLESLGAIEIPRTQFLNEINQLVKKSNRIEKWCFDQA